MNETKHDPTPISRVRTASLYSFVAFLSITALFAIATVLSGEFGEFQGKVLITTSVIAVASICSLCCSAYSARTGHVVAVVGGFSMAVVAAGMLILGIWAEIEADAYWKTTGVLCVFGIAGAHALALLVVRLPTGQRWLQIGTTVTLLALATTIAVMIVLDRNDEGLVRLLAVLAILAALETLVIPIVGRLAKAQRDPMKETLSLIKREDGMYEDQQGYLYEVNRMSTKPDAGDG